MAGLLPRPFKTFPQTNIALNLDRTLLSRHCVEKYHLYKKKKKYECASSPNAHASYYGCHYFVGWAGKHPVLE